MDDRETNTSGNVQSAAAINSPALQASLSEATASDAKKAQHRKSMLALLKRVAWRISGVYVWLRLILTWFGGRHLVEVSDNFFVSRLIAGLNWLGFVPVNTPSLGVVLRAGWVLIITGYNPWQLLGLLIYIFFFPLSFLFYAAFGNELAKVRPSPQQTSKPGLRPVQNRLPAVALFGSGLLGWFILFGDTTRNRPIWAAVILSGALTFALAYRAFQRAKPTSHADAAPLISVEKWANGAISNTAVQWEKNKLQKRGELLIVIKMYRWYKSVLVNIAAFIRGKRGRDRIYSLVVFQYALSLLLLLASAVLFWALCIRVTAPTGFQFQQCLMISVSHFLPGVPAPTLPSQVPVWAVVGPGFTAWILLGIYVGATTSLLQGKQSAYAQRAQITYALLRQAIAAIRLYIARLNSLSE